MAQNVSIYRIYIDSPGTSPNNYFVFRSLKNDVSNTHLFTFLLICIYVYERLAQIIYVSIPLYECLRIIYGLDFERT